MLGFFPKVYDDELLYSVFARYHVQSGNTVIKDTINDLFGRKSAYATADFPTNLTFLYKELSYFGTHSIDEWINKHTMFNYYTNFLPKNQREKIYDAMLNDSRETTIQTMVGMTTSSVKSHLYFRYCPKCQKEDLTEHGDVYWRMTHQLPSVHICLTHNEPLLESHVLIREKNKHQYIKATKENCNSNMTNVVTSEKTSYWLPILAEQSYKLATTAYEFDLKELEATYHFLLQLKGYKTMKGHTDHKKLADDFTHFYGMELLELLQSSVDYDNQHCWLKTITRKHRKGFHPVRHLLFILFLDETLDSVSEQQIKVFHPFGKGPYLCLNKACNHYEKPVIKEVKVTRCTDTKLPVGTFECKCGFIYSRRGPDKQPSDKKRIGRIKSFGSVWQKQLDQYIHKDKKSYRATARLLNVDTNTVIKYANVAVETVSSEKSSSQNLEPSKKQEWLWLQEEYPDLLKTELRKLAPALYAWLYRNDKQWIDDHSPTKKKVTYVNNRVDWNERDRTIRKEVEQAVYTLLNKEKPKRLTVSSIGRELNQLALIEKKIDKLPLTKSCLEDVTESIDEFQIRRIHWAVEELEKENEEVKEWMIMRKAGLKPTISDEVRNEIEQVVIDHQLQV